MDTPSVIEDPLLYGCQAHPIAVHSPRRFRGDIPAPETPSTLGGGGNFWSALGVDCGKRRYPGLSHVDTKQTILPQSGDPREKEWQFDIDDYIRRRRRDPEELSETSSIATSARMKKQQSAELERLKVLAAAKSHKFTDAPENALNSASVPEYYKVGFTQRRAASPVEKPKRQRKHHSCGTEEATSETSSKTSQGKLKIHEAKPAYLVSLKQPSQRIVEMQALMKQAVPLDPMGPPKEVLEQYMKPAPKADRRLRSSALVDDVPSNLGSLSARGTGPTSADVMIPEPPKTSRTVDSKQRPGGGKRVIRPPDALKEAKHSLGWRAKLKNMEAAIDIERQARQLIEKTIEAIRAEESDQSRSLTYLKGK